MNTTIVIQPEANIVKDTIVDLSLNKTARIAGFFYLIYLESIFGG